MYRFFYSPFINDKPNFKSQTKAEFVDSDNGCCYYGYLTKAFSKCILLFLLLLERQPFQNKIEFNFLIFLFASCMIFSKTKIHSLL